MKAKKKLWLCVLILALTHALILFAGFCAPYDYASQNREVPFAPPTRLHSVDRAGHFHLRPFVYARAARPGDSASYKEDSSWSFPLRFLVRGDPYTVAGLFTSRWHLFGVPEPARVFLLGTDDFGRDQLSRLLYGGQISLFAGLLAAALSLGAGLLLGSISGFSGGWVDELVMRLAELFLALPWLYLLLGVRAFLPLRLSPGEAFLLVIVVVGLSGWARPARLVRGVVLSAKERNYVLAARGFGAPTSYLLRRHVLPQTYGVLLTQAALLIPQYILAEVTLSFLGLGVGEPVPTWGNMLARLQNYYILTSDWWMLIPGLFLVLVLLLYSVLSNNLQERLRFRRP